MTETIEWTPKARAVLASASELFYEHGIHAVGVDAVAERAGVTKKTLYDRFGSKERLVVEYLAERDRQWRDFLQQRLSETPPEPQARIAELFAAAADWSRSRGTNGCAMINAHAEIGPEHPAYAVVVGQKAWMLELITETLRPARVRDPGRLAEQVLLLHEGAVVTAPLHALDDPFARAAAAASALVEAAVGAPR